MRPRRFITPLALAAGAAALVAGIGPLVAQAPAPSERVGYPKGFETSFVVYSDVDRFDTKRVRRMYVNREAAAAAKPGEPLPDGTILVMEDHAPELDASGAPVLDGKGRMKPTAKILAVAVMEKRKGWGEAIPAERRNGDWDYAAFSAEGVRNTQANIPGCFTCHLNRTNRDFTFTFFKNVADGFRP